MLGVGRDHDHAPLARRGNAIARNVLHVPAVPEKDLGVRMRVKRVVKGLRRIFGVTVCKYGVRADPHVGPTLGMQIASVPERTVAALREMLLNICVHGVLPFTLYHKTSDFPSHIRLINCFETFIMITVYTSRADLSRLIRKKCKKESL